MIIIGELINGTRKRVKQAIAQRDGDYLAGLARKQEEAGASFIDVNPGSVGDQEVEDMKWLVQVVQSATGKPLSLDTPNADAIRAALEVYTGPTPLINSISLESERWETMLPIVKGAGCHVVALAVSDAGMPTRAGDRERAALPLRPQGQGGGSIPARRQPSPHAFSRSRRSAGTRQRAIPRVDCRARAAPDCA